MTGVLPRQMRYDVVVVGASVAGSIAALCLRRAGASVVVLERKKAMQDYKVLCTHFVQPSAIPVLRELDLLEPLERAGAVRTKAAFWTGSDWIDPSGDYATDQGEAHAYNIERRILDPLLRASLVAHGADLILGAQANAINVTEEGCEITASFADRPDAVVYGRLAVAADGRQSRMATLLENPQERYTNDRAASFAYFEGVAAPARNRSLFLRREHEMGFLYPLGGGRALLAAYLPKQQARALGRGLRSSAHLVEFIASFPDVPDLKQARIASPVFGYADYPNILRKPVCSAVAFVGDAALSLDPMSGVGCGFAISSAHMLAQQTQRALVDRGDLAPSLRDYAAGFSSSFLPHAQGIRADSLIATSAASRATFYRMLAQNLSLQQAFIALTGRLISPGTFQQAYLRAMVGKPHITTRA